MYSLTARIFSAVIFYSLIIFTNQKYTPDWDSLDKRSLPSWYDESKIGIFIHWGVFSVPSFRSEWYVVLCDSENIRMFCRMWYSWKGDNPNPETVAFMEKNYPSDWTYADFAEQFRAEFFG